MPNTPSRTVGARALAALALLASLCAVAVVGSDPAEAASTAYVLSPRNVQRPRPTRAIDTSGDRVVIGGDGITSNTSTGGVNVFRLVAGTYVLEGSLRPPAPALASGFGETVAIDGDYVVVGAAVADVGGENAGAAFVYRWDGSTWSLQQELVPSVRTVGSQFGRSVDIEGTSVIVGQLGGTIAGRVFTRSGGTWTQQQVLSPAGASPTWQMGTSAAISGTTLVLGGPNATVDGITAAGRLAVFTRSGGTWTEQQALTATAPTTSANLGVDVAIDGDTVVAGAHQPGVGPGSATVFTRSGTTWTQQQVLTPPGGQPLDFFGFAVGVEGDLAVIGAYGDDESALAAGSAYTYSRTGTTWSQVAKLFPAGASSAGSFGSSVGVADGRAVVGSLVNGVPYQDSGAFEARTWDGTAWSAPVVTLPVREEHAGTSVDVSGGVAAVGVPEGWTASGVAGYVVVSYASPSSWTATTPTQVVRLVGAAGDRFGAAVALQGSTLAVGVPGAGAVEVFERSGTTTTWNAVQTLTVAGAVPSDDFGAAVAIDGDRLVVGAPGDDDDGANAGAVFVSERSGGTWGAPVRSSVTDPARAGDGLGASVAVQGDLVVAGAPRDDTQGNNAGAFVRLTPDGGGGWHTASAADLVAPAAASAGDNVGASVAVSADRIVAGAPDADPQGAGSGQAWVVNRSSGDINPLVRPGGAAGDHYGRSVAADGDDVAVGADGDDDQGGDSGSVYRFRVSGGVLTGAEKHLAPDGEAGDGFGRSVALDATSAWLVAGAPGWDGGTPDLGSGYAFEYPPAAAAPGELRVTTNPAVASTILVDGIPRDQWGLTWLDLPDGTYEVCFTDVPGFVTPPCEDATVVAGQTATVQGDFVAQATLQVLTSPPVASTITLQDLTLGTPAVAANKWGVFRRVTPDHAVRVCFGPVAGWNPPPCQDVPAGSLGSGEFAQATGVFTENASAPGPVGKGELRVTTDPALAATILVDQVPRDEWGLTWLELDPGTYEVCATDVPGYSTPACTQAVVQGGVTTQLSLTFTQLGYLRILTEPAQEATVSVDGVPRNDWGAWFPLELGPHEVCFGPAKGTQAQPDPPCQDVVGPGPGQTLTVTGTYP